MPEVERRLKEMIVERLFLKIDPQSIGSDEALLESYDIDSVALFEVIVGLEEEFGICLADSEFKLNMFRDVGSIADFVRRKLGEPS